MHLIEAKSILSATGGMNLTRGCVHGCIYCDSRSACYQMDHAFEDVAVKANGLPLLEEALRRKRKRCMLGTGSMSDPYMPIPEVLESTRGALKLAHKYGFGFTLITKSALVLRDLDLLTIGMVNDMYAESRNDDCKYAELATQEDFDRF